MFNYTKVFSGFSVNDLAKAKAFYSEILGIKVNETSMVLELLISDDTKIVVYPKPNHVAATFTILNFSVENIETAMDELAAKGVKFEYYHEKDFSTDSSGIYRGGGPLIAWFKDPAGNILSVLQER